MLLPLAAPAGRADGVSFSSPTGDWGSTTYTFTIHGISITATAFNGGNLFAKNSIRTSRERGWRAIPVAITRFSQNGWDSRLYPVDLLGLIAAGFTNVKFQMGSTEGGAYSSAGVSGSGRSANASTLVGSQGTLNLGHELERKEPLPWISPRPGGMYCWTNLSFSIHPVFRSPHRTPYCWPACSVSRASLLPDGWQRKRLSSR